MAEEGEKVEGEEDFSGEAPGEVSEEKKKILPIIIAIVAAIRNCVVLPGRQVPARLYLSGLPAPFPPFQLPSPPTSGLFLPGPYLYWHESPVDRPDVWEASLF